MKLWLVTSIRFDARRLPPASTIQNLRMGAALAEAGHEIVLWVSEANGEAGDVFEGWLGIRPPGLMRFHAVAPAGADGTKKTPFFGRLRGGRVLASARARFGDPDAIISRSPLALSQLRSHPLRPRGALLLLEYQYPEYMQLWRGWMKSRGGAERPELREAARRLRAGRERELAMLGAADGILHCAPAHLRLMKAAGYAGAAVPLPSGAPPPADPAAVDAGRDGSAEFDLGYAGRISAENGIETMLQAVARSNSMTLLLVGSGGRDWRERLEARIGGHGLGGRVRIEGGVPPARVREQLRRCGIGLVPLSRRCGPEKRDYASPLKLTDWLSAGVPVIASSVPSIRQHVTHDRHVRLVEPDDPGALAREIAVLRADPEAASRLAREGLALAARLVYHERARRVTELVLKLRTDGPIPQTAGSLAR